MIRKAELHSKIQNDHYEQYKFEPKINNLSRQLASTTRVSTYQDEFRAKKKLRAQESVAELQKICSFSPKVNSFKRFGEVESRYRQGENIVGDIERSRIEKKIVMEGLRRENEVKVLGKCTFKPKSIMRVRSESTIQVKGTERFHELRIMAKRQQFDREEREKKLLHRDSTRELIYSPS